MYTIVYVLRAGDAQGNIRKMERTQAGVLITGTFILKGVIIMAICRSGARFDKDSYYETIVDESNEDVMVRGTKNGEPVEWSLGSGGGGETFVVTVRTDENNNATADKTFEEIEQAWKSGSAITLKIVYSYKLHGVNFDECYTVPASIKTLWSDGGVATLDSVYGATLMTLTSTDEQIGFISCINAVIDSSGVGTQRGYRNFE